MRFKAILQLTFIFPLFLFSCNKNLVSLDFTNAREEVAPLTNLIFRFDKTLIADSLINQWDSTKYISFEPAIPGKFRWEHGDELVFSPSAPLRPATNYTVSLNSDILQYSKYDHFANAKDLRFHTADLKLENTNSTWVVQDPNKKTFVPQLELIFNYPIDPAMLKEKLVLTLEGKPVPYTLQTLSGSSRISIRLENITPADKDYEIKLQFEKGLIPVGGTNATAETTSATAMVSSPFILRINDIESSAEAQGGAIQITTSQKINTSDISRFISFSPAVKFTTEPTDNGFTIRSEAFDVEKSYQLTIKNGLRGEIGGTLTEDYINNLTFGKLEPSISFLNKKGTYLSSKGEKNIEISISNVQKLKLIVSRIYENNLLSTQRSSYYPVEKDRNNGYDESSESTAGDVIFEQEIDATLLPKYGKSRLLHFNIEDKLPQFKGIYHIMIRSTKDYWVRDSRMLSVSDLGMIAKEGSGSLVIFANSIQTAQPLQGVNMTAYGANNQILGTGSTDDQGVATIVFQRREFAGFKPAMIIAKTDNDFNYLPFNSTRVNTSRFDVSGKTMNSTGLDAFIYPERDIYRPGEKINYSVIVRDYSWKTPGEIPVKLKFLLPNGKEFKSFRKTLNTQGSAEGDIDLPVTAITGTYSLEVYTSNDILLSAQPFHIEEFVPDRIKVTAQLNKPFYEPGNTADLSIKAVNFFGPPAAGRKYECEIQLKQKSFIAKKYNNYDFSLTNQKTFYDKVVREGKTDEAGEAKEKFLIEDIYINIGLLQADFYSTVFDETGRPVSRLSSANIYTQPVYFGLADDGSYYYALNQKATFKMVAVDKNQALLTSTAEVSVIKHEYRTVISKADSYFRYESQEEDKLISTSMVKVSGEETSFSFVPRTAGEYQLRVAIPGSKTYVSKTFYSYGSWGSDNSSFEVSNEGQIDIQPDRASYSTGESVRALFKAPFDGRMLVTLETDRLISYQWVNVEKRSASVELKLTAEAMPNAYITATLIKPHGISDIPLTVAHGFVNLMVEEKERKMHLQISAVAKTRSKTTQEIKVKATAGSMVTLAVVDNGVLQVSDFYTPDPYGFFYARRALGVNGFDIYPLLLPELKARLSSTGGDSETDMTKRTNPMPAKRIKIVSYWSGIKKADGNGNVSFSVAIPQFSGELRLMAVAYKDDQFGAAESKMTVADPLVLSSALPRFLSPSDSISLPITITNTTAKTSTGTATVSAGGGVAVQGAKQQSFSIPANSEKRLYFTVTANPVIGIGKILFEINSSDGKFTDETEIGIRPAASLQKSTGSGSIVAGSSQTIAFDNADYIPSSISRELFITRFPGAGLSKYLSRLLEYPYGCTEQTISSAFPQLYFGELSDALHVVAGSRQTANYNVQEAIRKIKMRQLYNGAVTLWDDEKSADWWTSIYATHFLLEAGKAGFDVDKSLTETLLGYINSTLKDRKLVVYYYNGNQQKKIVPKEVIYGLYVLALSSRPNAALMNYYKANPQLLTLDSRYLLAAAFALSGDKTSYKQFLPAKYAGEAANTETGGSFSSDIRDEAMSLNVLIDVDPTNAQIPDMARHVSEKLKQRDWYSTQELVFGFLSLGKLAKQQGISSATAEISIQGKQVASFKGADLKLIAAQLKSGKPEIITSGKGNLFYYWEEKGIPATGPMKETDNYLRVRKRFYDRFGTPIFSNTFKQNELIVVRLSLEKLFANDVQNIVITDLLPAGFEIENPRTKDLPGMEWIQDASTPVYLDVRDDRINLFVNSESQKQNYYYTVRAVSPGIFKMGPVSADAMYDGSYHSYNGAGMIKVIE